MTTFSIEFGLIYIATFTIKLSLRCFAEAETQSLSTQVERKTSLLTRKKKTLSRHRLTRRNNPAESQLGKEGEKQGDRAEKIKETKR